MWLWWIYVSIRREIAASLYWVVPALCVCFSLLHWMNTSTNLGTSLSAAFSSLTLCPQTLAAFVFLHSQLHLNSPCATAWTLSQGSKLGNHRAHLIHFPSLIAHCPSLLDSQYLQYCSFRYFAHFKNCFRQETKSGSYSILISSGSLNF